MVRETAPNLLLLTIDAWRADFIKDFAGIPLTPALQSQAHHTLYFDQAYSTGSWTTPGIVSMMTGDDALSHGVWYPWSQPSPSYRALPALLRQAGYHVANFCYKTSANNYQNLGYDPALAQDYPTGPDDNFLPQALGRLGNNDLSPWFAWYHYKYVHLPYWPEIAYRKMFDINEDLLPRHLLDSVCKESLLPRGELIFRSEDLETLQRLYAANVRRMDDFLGRVLASLEKSGQLHNTTIFITADHGDELLEHGHVGHASTARFATLYEEVLRIPLLIIDSRIQGPRLCHDRVQLQDVMPTLLSLAGVSPPPLTDAIDLVELVMSATTGSAGDRLALSNTPGSHRTLRFHSSRMGYQTPRSCEGQAVVGFLENTQKYILERFHSERRLLFDLARDPGEQHPLTSGPLVNAAHAHLLELYPELDLRLATVPRNRGLAQRLLRSLGGIRQIAAQTLGRH